MASLVARIDKGGNQAQTALQIALAKESQVFATKSPNEITQGALPMSNFLEPLWSDEQGQDIAEYAVMLAVILVLVVAAVRLIGGNANNAFSATASSIAQ
jgi:Flp pilus assembly pilin Flp